MKKTILLLLAIAACLFSRQSFSQQSKIDSLLQVLKTAKEDTGKASTLNLLGIEYYQVGEYDKSRKCSSEALGLSEKNDFTPGTVRAYLNTGITYFYEGNYEEALKYYESALAVSEKENYKLGIGKSYNNLGLVYTYQHRYSEGLKMHHSALKIFEGMKDATQMSNSYNNMGIIYEEQGNYAEALKSYLSALSISMIEKKDNTKVIGDAYLNIANVYYFQRSYSDAIANYLSALKQYEKIGYKQGIGNCYSNMGSLYQDLGKLDSALSFSQKAYAIQVEIGDKVVAGQAKNNIGFIHNKMGKFSEGKDDFSTALRISAQMGDTLNMSTSYIGLGEVYFYKGEFNEALKFLNTSLAFAKAVGSKGNIAHSYRLLADVCDKKGDYKNAYLNHKLYFAFSDSMLNEAKSKQMAEMQTRYETEKKDNDIALLSKDKELQDTEIKKQRLLKYSFMGGFGFVIVALLFGYRTYRTRQTLRLQDIRNKIAGDLHDDIGSTLNSISIYSEVARKKDAQLDEALEMIGDASRKIIDSMSDIVWTVNPENDNFSKIIFRMKSLAYNLFRAKKIEYIFHSDETLNTKKLSLEERRNFYLIFKEAINNLVKYSNATRVAITLANENEFIKLRLQDNGVGFDVSKDNSGNGIKNMKRRAAEMKAKFKIESTKGEGTQIELTLKQ